MTDTDRISQLKEKINSEWTSSSEYVRCTVQFLEDNTTLNVIIRICEGDEVDEYDDSIFFYVRCKAELEDLCEEGVEDFVIIAIDKIY